MPQYFFLQRSRPTIFEDTFAVLLRQCLTLQERVLVFSIFSSQYSSVHSENEIKK